MRGVLPVGLVEHLQERTLETGELGFEDTLAPGAAIRSVGGPFDRFLGEFRGMDGEGRARVLLEMMGRPVAVLLSRQAVMAV
jgi:transcription antitermination factor NusG